MKIKVEIGDVYRFVGVSDEFHTHMSCYKVINVTEHKAIIGCNFTVNLTCNIEGYEYTLPVELLNDTDIFTKVDKTKPVNLMKLLFDTIKE